MTRSARNAVLDRIRLGLGRPQGARNITDVQQRMSAPPRFTRPAIDQNNLERFVAKALGNLCTVERLATRDAAAAAVERLMRERELGRTVSVAENLRALPWPASLSVDYGTGRREERVSVTDALTGIAETGSLIFCSSSDSPAALNFLPELHVAVLHEADIVTHLEDVWPKVRALPVWPRAVNIVSGPSRTADVAQIIVRPAHGPKSLHILLVEAQK